MKTDLPHVPLDYSDVSTSSERKNNNIEYHIFKYNWKNVFLRQKKRLLSNKIHFKYFEYPALLGMFSKCHNHIVSLLNVDFSTEMSSSLNTST